MDISRKHEDNMILPNRLNYFIKIISTFLMIAALILVLYSLKYPIESPIFSTMRILAIFALTIHLMEGIAGGIIAYTQGLNPLKYGIYTFFTGTLALWEMWVNRAEINAPSNK